MYIYMYSFCNVTALRSTFKGSYSVFDCSDRRYFMPVSVLEISLSELRGLQVSSSLPGHFLFTLFCSFF